jgi:hypothetical protein
MTQHLLSSLLSHSGLKTEVEFLQGVLCAEIQANMGPSFVTGVLPNVKRNWQRGQVMKKGREKEKARRKKLYSQ